MYFELVFIWSFIPTNAETQWWSCSFRIFLKTVFDLTWFQLRLFCHCACAHLYVDDSDLVRCPLK
jgi:hypothetical protein